MTRGAWVWALLALHCTGCALLQPASVATPANAPANGVVAAPKVVVQAPGELKPLLEKHLDLVRLGGLATDEPVSASEWARLADATPAQVSSLLQTEGYFDASATVTGSPDQGLQVRVQPGPRSAVVAVKLQTEGELGRLAEQGNGPAQALLAQWQSAFGLKEGQSFRNEAWNSAKADALARLRAAGYAAANWVQTAADVDADQHRVTLSLKADSGPLFRSGEVAIEGLKAHDAATVRHLAGFETGTPVTDALLLDYQDRLQKAGLFEQISVTLDTEVQGAAAARIVVRLKELPLQQAVTGIGFSANTGARASLEHVHRRVFGQALTARNKLEWGKLRQAWDGELASHPGENMIRNVLGGAVERLKSDQDTVLTQSLRLGRSQDLPRVERWYFVELERSVRQATAERNEALATSANYHLIWRELDSAILPTRGFTLNLQGGVGHSQSNTNQSGQFLRSYARFTGYWPVGSWYTQGRVELGQVWANDAVYVPDSKGFRAGGDDSVRGYAYRSLAPEANGVLSSGRALGTASVELAHVLTPQMPSLLGAVFVDAGRAAEHFSDLKLAYGVGAGLRWRSPVGPLRMDLAWGQELRKLRLHFSVGIAF